MTHACMTHACNLEGRNTCASPILDGDVFLREMGLDRIDCPDCLARILENQQRVSAAIRRRLAELRGLS